ncbi:MAG: malto-oligosyltrehalose synthase [bacterium]
MSGGFTGRPPTSTYRLQIRPGFDLAAAAEVVDYLDQLGVGAVYLSPILRAADGSEHGYDVVDHQEIDPARGGAVGLLQLAERAQAIGLDIVLDLVPNHAGVADATQNPSWWDVLELGQESAYASWYDIDWGRAPILVPQLGDDVDPARNFRLERSERTRSGWELRYYEHSYPVAPGTGPADGEPVDAAAAASVHERQHYRLVSYRRADDEQNYRRFFAVTDLAGLRVEDPAVFDATHEVLLGHVAQGRVQGLRIDHPDGLVDPGRYLDRLRAAAPSGWITVEKILKPGEDLPESWPVDGTTGYDALTEVSDVLTDPAGEEALTAVYREITGDERDFADHAVDGKRGVATTILHAEILRLVQLVPDVDGAEAALTELAVAFAVYRSYLPLGAERLADAVALATRRRPDLSDALGALLPRLGDPADELALRFQQVTGAVTAKGVEDTAYYRYSRAVWLNEVGGDPATVGRPLAEFHAAQQRRQERWPASMTTLSTHDTKRGEDVRARLAVLAEIPDRWAAAARTLAESVPVPNPAFGLLLWQTFVGTGFIDRDRMHAYAEKAMREANDGTGWRDPDASFEAAVHSAVDAAYDQPAAHRALSDLIEATTAAGWSNALAAKLIQLTIPGVPDVYQGTELWDNSLVDPDNRRPVDFDARRAGLAALDAGADPEADADPRPPVDATGRAKLLVTSRALRLRRDRPELFTGYAPVGVEGRTGGHVVAYDRGGAVAVATRLPVGLAARGGWHDTTLRLPAGGFVDVVTGQLHRDEPRVGDVLAVYPVALLART